MRIRVWAIALVAVIVASGGSAGAGPVWNPEGNLRDTSDPLKERPKSKYPYQVVTALPRVERVPEVDPLLVNVDLETKRTDFVAKTLQLIARAEAALALYELSQEKLEISTVKSRWTNFMDAADVAELAERIEAGGWKLVSTDKGGFVPGLECRDFSYYWICHLEPFLIWGLNVQENSKDYDPVLLRKVKASFDVVAKTLTRWDNANAGQWSAKPVEDTTPLLSETNQEPIAVKHLMTVPVFPPVVNERERASWKKTAAWILGGAGIVTSIAAMPFTAGLSAAGLFVSISGLVTTVASRGLAAVPGFAHAIKPRSDSISVNVFWGMNDAALERIIKSAYTDKRESEWVALLLPLMLVEKGVNSADDGKGTTGGKSTTGDSGTTEAKPTVDTAQLDKLRAAYLGTKDGGLFKAMQQHIGKDWGAVSSESLIKVVQDTTKERRELVQELMQRKYMGMEYILSTIK